MSLSQRIKIFITYSHKDRKFAERLYIDLSTQGLDAFFDVESIKGGDRFAEEISRGLKECDIYIPILSFNSLKSPWCLEEIYGAITLSNLPGRNRRPNILSVLIEECTSEMPVWLLTRLYFNFEGRYQEGFQELLERGLELGKTPRNIASLQQSLVKAIPQASIRNVRTEYNVMRDTELGMVIYVSFNISGFRGRKGQVVAYFYFINGSALKDLDQTYYTKDGNVSASADFSPGYDNTDYNDLQIFMPYSQLHLSPGSYSIKYNALIWNLEDNQSLAQSDWVYFDYRRDPVIINKVWVEYNKFQGGQSGMLIHLNLEISGYRGQQCWAAIYFCYSDGSLIKDVDNQYNSTDGQVMIHQDFAPLYDDTILEDLKLFMPYSQIHTPSGRSELKFFVNIWDEKWNNVLAVSDWVPFWYEH